MDLTHFDQDGNAWMVDVSDKDITTRTAVAEGFCFLFTESLFGF